MKRLGVLLGLILFMMTSQAFAADYELEVYDQLSNEKRMFTPPGNIDFTIPLPRSKWVCGALKEKEDKVIIIRQIICLSPDKYMVTVGCTVFKTGNRVPRHEEARLVVGGKVPEKGKKPIPGYSLIMSCKK